MVANLVIATIAIVVVELCNVMKQLAPALAMVDLHLIILQDMEANVNVMIAAVAHLIVLEIASMFQIITAVLLTAQENNAAMMAAAAHAEVAILLHQINVMALQE